MKKINAIIFGLCATIMLQAQISKTVTITAGGLSSALNSTEKSTITNLTVNGKMDARDFKTMRDSMPVLAITNLLGSTVDAYTGTYGTASTSSTVYAVNTVPNYAYYNGSGYNLKTTSVILPSSISSIGSSAFAYCKKLGSVSIPSIVTTIGNFAFGNCTSLISITIPTTVTSIEGYAFYGCNGLTSATINIPALTTTIGDQAFAACNGQIVVNASNPNYSSVDGVLLNKAKTILLQCLTSKTGIYTIPTTVTTIESSSFYNCSGITSIIIPSITTTINNFAFMGCIGLTSINVPSSVTSIGYGAFNTASGTITVDNGNPNYSAVDGILYNKTKTTLIACPVSKSGSYIIPSSVTSIGDLAFQDCILTSVTIPSSVASIADYAFYNCTGLTSLYVNRPVPIDLSSSPEVFLYVNANCILYVPVGSVSAYQSALKWKNFTQILEGATKSKEITENNDFIYPNPVRNILYFNMDVSKVFIFDLNGKMVLSNQLMDNSINVSNLMDGMYAIKMVTPKGIITKKIFKQ